MEVFKQLNMLKGHRIRFKTYEGEYEGTVITLCPVLRMVVVNHTFLLPKRTYMGNLRFICHEIDSFTCIDLSDSERPVEDTYGGFQVSNGNCHENFDVADLYEEKDRESECENEDGVSLENISAKDYALKLPESLRDQLPSNFAILDSVNDEFYNALQCVLQERSIGVSFEGPEISRKGILTWICISVTSCTFLFDIGSLQERAFDNGLRNIFQDKDIEKVIHDSRKPSDCLFHQFKTRIVNVFDTQVADFIIQMHRSKSDKVLQHVSSIDTCIFQHLELPSEYLCPQQQYRTYSEKVISYNLRPINKTFLDFAIKNVIYLTLLKEKLFDLLMAPFYRSVNIYLNVLANATKEELSLGLSIPCCLPPALLMEGIKTVCFKEFVDIPYPVSSGSVYQNPSNCLKDLLDSLTQKINLSKDEESKITDGIKETDFHFTDNPKNGEDVSFKSFMQIDKSFSNLINSQPMNVLSGQSVSSGPEVESCGLIKYTVNSDDSNKMKNVNFQSKSGLKKINKVQNFSSCDNREIAVAENSCAVDSIDKWEKLCSIDNVDNVDDTAKFKIRFYPG